MTFQRYLRRRGLKHLPAPRSHCQRERRLRQLTQGRGQLLWHQVRHSGFNNMGRQASKASK